MADPTEDDAMTDADARSPGAPETVFVAANHGIPNHPDWPALIYHGAVPADARAIERVFDANGWPPRWRDGIFDHHHYHDAGHEALGVAQGRVSVRIGGPAGCDVELHAGDVVVLPAGTGHCRLAASADLLVVGAYPPGQTGDVRRPPATAARRARIAAVPRPERDPVCGVGGPLTALWWRP
jgi:uncharacterized protein YjlB